MRPAQEVPAFVLGSRGCREGQLVIFSWVTMARGRTPKKTKEVPFGLDKIEQCMLPSPVSHISHFMLSHIWSDTITDNAEKEAVESEEEAGMLL